MAIRHTNSDVKNPFTLDAIRDGYSVLYQTTRRTGGGGNGGVNGPFGLGGGQVVDTTTFPGYAVVVFTSPGTLSLTGAGTATVEYLVVGGGGNAAGGDPNGPGGGGGAGAYIHITEKDIVTGDYPVTVGGPGGSSVFDGVTAPGGGNGGTSVYQQPTPGNPGQDSPGGSGGGGGAFIAGGGGNRPAGAGGGSGAYGNPGGAGNNANPAKSGGGGGAGGGGGTNSGGNGLATFTYVPPGYGDAQDGVRYFAGGGRGGIWSQPSFTPATIPKGGEIYQGGGGRGRNGGAGGAGAPTIDPGQPGIVILAVAIDQ